MKRSPHWNFWFLVFCVFLSPHANGQSVDPPKLRLGNEVKPVRIAMDLTIIPSEENFSGTAIIDLEFHHPTSIFWINSNEIQVQEASLEAGSEAIQMNVLPQTSDFLGFRLSKPVGPGSAKLRIQYKGKILTKDNIGIFKQKEGDDWYVFTDFEPMDARRLVPCFDEPAFKHPWSLTLHVRESDQAFSNTPVLSEEKESGGMKKIVFAQTKPLPAYLIAVAVGPFDVVDAGKAGKKNTPLRIITPKGKAKEARYAAETSGPLLVLLEDYFGIPFPYEKLDQIAVPEFGGAMENAGLITFYMQGLLAKPEEENLRWKQVNSYIAAHEMAHQWFGDLVTMNWYDDIWLNEGFASWLENKIIMMWKPEWEFEVEEVETRSSAMSSDSLITARKVRQPIESAHDIQNAFDKITYDKGNAVISMFETWAGPEKFQKAVHRYLTEHSWGNATAQDFLAALSAEAGADAAPAFATFLDQSGVPLVSVELKCESVPRVLLKQSRYLPAGSRGKAQEQLWQIPVCVVYGSGSSRNRTCTLMKTKETELKLDQESCPAWILANEGEAGYYHALYQQDQFARLLADGGKQLTIPERVGIVADISALVESNSLPIGDALHLFEQILQDPNPHLYTATIEVVEGYARSLLSQELRADYARYIRKVYGAKAHELGWKSIEGENDQLKLLRPLILSLVANQGQDQELASQAVDLAKQWLKDRRSVNPEMIRTILVTAAQNGDSALWEAFVTEVKKTKDRREKSNLFRALGSFREPELVEKSLNLTLQKDFDSSESAEILFWGVRDRQTDLIAYEFVKKNFDSIAKNLPSLYLRFMPYIAVSFCDEKKKVDAQSFLEPRIKDFTGAPRRLQQVLEEIDLCIALKEAQASSLASFLRKN